MNTDNREFYLGTSSGAILVLCQLIIWHGFITRIPYFAGPALLVILLMGLIHVPIFVALLAHAIYKKLWNQKLVLVSLATSAVGVGIYVYWLHYIETAKGSLI